MRLLRRALLIVVLLSLSACGRDFVYKMNTGVVCKYRLYQDTRAEFYGCDDGRRYIDPPNYEEVRL